MKFEDALAALKRGYSIRRSAWEPGHTIYVGRKFFVSACDVLADDWEVV